MKKIEVTPEVRAQLREEHCLVNDQTVYKALRYETDGPLAKMIRRRALELGGKEWVTTDEVESSEKLSFKKVDNIDDIESFDKSAIPVVVKAENKKEQVYSSGGIHGLLWFCTLGIIPSWQTEAETHTMNVATPLGAKSGVCTVTKRRYWGWVPYMLPFGSSEEDVQCEEELLSRLVAQYKKEWTAESVAKINATNSERLKKLRDKADELLAQKKYEEVISICNAEKNKKFISKYMPKAIIGAVNVAMSEKDYQRVVELCKYANNDSKLLSIRGKAIVNLIASSPDEATLSERIKKYGKQLSVSQMVEAGEKASNAIVKAKIIEWQKNIVVMADKKITTEIREFIKRKNSEHKLSDEYRRIQTPYYLKKHDAQYLAKLLSQISSADVFCCIVKELHVGGDDAFEALIDGVKEDNLIAWLGKSGFSFSERNIIMKHIVTPNALFNLAVNEKNATLQYRGASAGEQALAKIDDKDTLVQIALLAENEVISGQAKKKIGDKKLIVDGIVKLLKENKITEENAKTHVAALNDGEATIALYNAVQGRGFKQLIFSKLSVADRKTIRDGNMEKCKQMIDFAKSKAKETFEMGGFYLGMDIADIDVLIGYYFPDWSIEEGYDDDDEKDVRVVWVPEQRSVFCRADKDGKVWQLNFGKNILKKFCKYDVQDEQEWARAYSREHGIDMKYVYLNKETTVASMSGNFDVTTYKAWLNQKTWQWKNNAKGYRLVYFGEREIETIHGDMVKKFAAAKFRTVSADAGVLRVTIEND